MNTTSNNIPGAAPSAVAGPAREEIAALRAEHGITSSGRGVKEFEQVDAFVRAVLQRWGAAPALEAPAAPAKPAPVEPVTPPVIDAKAMKEAFDSATAEGKSFNDALRAAACATIWRRAKRPDGAPDAVGAALVSIAVDCALHAEERHSYLPNTPAQAATWRPHEWVLKAMSRAISFDHMMNQVAPAAPAETELMQALRDLVNALRERHYGRMPEEVQSAYDKAWAIVFAGPAHVAAPAAPAVDTRDAALQQAIAAMQLAESSHGAMLMSDPPQEMWKCYGVSRSLQEAISAAQAAAKGAAS
ncbi:hypothetical protein [Delftia acidovorans]|uniref:Uncharacterized protein n=1 Tax=Delftia acidovorans TaxID=80866 RepID=A0AAJ2R5S0_DELAC|nr:hypothetical protein [Delftia acidovorans]MDX4956214.1 hypothetical protein [Delftia acidovorans]